MKIKILFLSALLLFLFTTTQSQIIDEPYDFPIKPGTPEWGNFASYEDRRQALQVPDDILKRLSTRALVETCLDYPFFVIEYFALSSRRNGISYVINSFNGYVELLQRQDAFTELFKKYQSSDPKLEDPFIFVCIVVLLYQDEILEQTSYEEKILLLAESYSKFKKMQEYGTYDVTRCDPLFYLMAKLLLAIDEPEITAEIESSQNIVGFLYYMFISMTYDPIEEIEILVKRVLDAKGAIDINEVKDIPITYNLSQNYPNPFNPMTKIEYFIPEASRVKLSVYNTLGQEVVKLVDDYQSAGKYVIDFNATNLPTGTYFYKLQTGDFTIIKKMILIK